METLESSELSSGASIPNVLLDFIMKFPGRRAFYKYVPPDTVLDILKNQTVRYSSPLKFNDPFDHQTGLHLSFDLNDFLRKLIDKFEFLAKNPAINLVDPVDSIAKLVSIIREYYPTHGFPREKYDLHIEPILAEAAHSIEQTRLEFKEHWIASLEKTRTFCVAEDRDNLLMWAHYAKDHTGAVLELWSLPEEDNAISVARKVSYVKQPPSFFTEDEFIDDFCGVKRLDITELTRRSIHTKSEHWAYENEWRVYFPLSESPGRYEDLNLRASEFKAIYFGCCANSEFIDLALPMLAANFPSTKKFLTHKSASGFKVNFSEI